MDKPENIIFTEPPKEPKSPKQDKLVIDNELASIGSEFGVGPRRILSIQNFSDDFVSVRQPIDETNSSLALCGLSCGCLKFMYNPKVYLVLFCLVIFLQSMVVNGFINSSISSLEKRYGLSSSESSVIASIYDVGCMVVVLPVSYFGNRGHKPRWVGFGSLIMGFGCFVFASPQFFSGKYEFMKNHQFSNFLCQNQTVYHEDCNSKQSTSLNLYKYVFYLGMFIIGWGSSPLYTLGVAYIEETVNKEVSALYIGISTAITAVGPAVGYILLGIFLRIYIDISTNDPEMVATNRDIWIGAWWLGFIFAGICLFLVSIGLIIYPEVKINKVELTSSNDDSLAPKKRVISFTIADFIDLFKMVKNMFTNLTYFCLNIGTACTLLALSGISTYGPKYLEHVFGLTTSVATVTAGVISVPTLAFGALMGGILLNRYAWKLPGALTFMAITTIISVPMSVCFLLTCTSAKMVGIDSPYIGKTLTAGDFYSECNKNCHCSDSRQYFQPICTENINYFSPCFAGCLNYMKFKTQKQFGNCTCLKSHALAFNNACVSKSCNHFYIFVVLLGFYLFTTYLRGAPMVTATMRAVKKREISLALGFQSIFSRVFGSIPGPIIFGNSIDTVCLYWSKRCSKIGGCMKYDSIKFSLKLFILTFVITCITGITFVIARFCITCKFKKVEDEIKSTNEK